MQALYRFALDLKSETRSRHKAYGNPFWVVEAVMHRESETRSRHKGVWDRPQWLLWPDLGVLHGSVARAGLGWTERRTSNVGPDQQRRAGVRGPGRAWSIRCLQRRLLPRAGGPVMCFPPQDDLAVDRRRLWTATRQAGLMSGPEFRWCECRQKRRTSRYP
jgi:hypothetical protein